jgi:hypothetical protein
MRSTRPIASDAGAVDRAAIDALTIPFIHLAESSTELFNTSMPLRRRGRRRAVQSQIP